MKLALRRFGLPELDRKAIYSLRDLARFLKEMKIEVYSQRSREKETNRLPWD